MRPEKKGKHVPVASGSDGGGGGIDVLPDEILEHILGFLPAEEAGRTSVLARRWRHRWKSATALNVTCIIQRQPTYWPKRQGLHQCQKAVSGMLCLRGRAPLEACHLTFGCFGQGADALCLSGWVRHVVVLCQVQRFRLENLYNGDVLMLDGLPLVSRHLTRLELVGIELNNEFCDLSSCCPALQHLDIAHCSLWDAKKLSLLSMKSLSITGCHFSTDFNTRIHVPSLVSLYLDSHLYRLLGSMPSLKKAFVRVPTDEYCGDDVGSHPLDCYCRRHITKEEDKKRFLLGGLSNAENLALLSETAMDLKLCPTFSNLKTRSATQ